MSSRHIRHCRHLSLASIKMLPITDHRHLAEVGRAKAALVRPPANQILWGCTKGRDKVVVSCLFLFPCLICLMTRWFLTYFLFSPRKLGKMFTHFDDFRIFFRWVGGEKPPTRLHKKIARPERQVTARWPASFSDTVLRSSKAPCIESHSQILDHGRVETKKTWLLKSVVLGEEILRTYICIYEDFRTSRYKDPYQPTSMMECRHFLFYFFSVAQLAIFALTKALARSSVLITTAKSSVEKLRKSWCVVVELIS